MYALIKGVWPHGKATISAAYIAKNWRYNMLNNFPNWFMGHPNKGFVFQRGIYNL